MATSESNVIPPEILADLDAVARQSGAGGVCDPELLRRVRERSEQVRREILQKHGVLNVAVDLIREIREEE